MTITPEVQQMLDHDAALKSRAPGLNAEHIAALEELRDEVLRNNPRLKAAVELRDAVEAYVGYTSWIHRLQGMGVPLSDVVEREKNSVPVRPLFGVRDEHVKTAGRLIDTASRL